MYISLFSNYDRKFRGNQNYQHSRGEVAVLDDDTTYIYNNMSNKNIKKFKKDYKEVVKGNFRMTGTYPRYTIEYCN